MINEFKNKMIFYFACCSCCALDTSSDEGIV